MPAAPVRPAVGHMASAGRLVAALLAEPRQVVLRRSRLRQSPARAVGQQHRLLPIHHGGLRALHAGAAAAGPPQRVLEAPQQAGLPACRALRLAQRRAFQGLRCRLSSTCRLLFTAPSAPPAPRGDGLGAMTEGTPWLVCVQLSMSIIHTCLMWGCKRSQVRCCQEKMPGISGVPGESSPGALIPSTALAGLRTVLRLRLQGRLCIWVAAEIPTPKVLPLGVAPVLAGMPVVVGARLAAERAGHAGRGGRAVAGCSGRRLHGAPPGEAQEGAVPWGGCRLQGAAHRHTGPLKLFRVEGRGQRGQHGHGPHKSSCCRRHLCYTRRQRCLRLGRLQHRIKEPSSHRIVPRRRGARWCLGSYACLSCGAVIQLAGPPAEAGMLCSRRGLASHNHRHRRGRLSRLSRQPDLGQLLWAAGQLASTLMAHKHKALVPGCSLEGAVCGGSVLCRPIFARR